MLAVLDRPAHHDTGAGIAALVLTSVAFAAILGASSHALRWSHAPERAKKPLREHVVFVERAQPAVVQAFSGNAARARVASSASTPVVQSSATSASPADSGAAPAGDPAKIARDAEARSSLAVPQSTLAPSFTAKALTRKPIEVHIHNPFAPPPMPTDADRAEDLEDLAVTMARLARTRVPGVAERDSLMAAASRDAVVPGRKAQMPGSARTTVDVGEKFPLLSPGPSRAQRQRDKAANAEYLSALERLQARVRQRRDSIIADSLARRPRPH